MKRLSALVVVLCLIAVDVQGQQYHERSGSATFRQEEISRLTRRNEQLRSVSGSGDNIDVTYYALKISINPSSAPRVAGSVRIEGKTTTDNVTAVTFDLRWPLTIDSVLVDGTTASFSRASETFTTEVSIPTIGTTVAFDVFYHGTPVPVFADYFQRTYQDGTSYPWVFTIAAPYGARDWWPCKDHPADKADSLDLWITCPEALSVGSQGKLISITPARSGNHTFHWKHRYPISTYLVSIAMTNYVAFSDWFKYSPTDSMEILNYLIPAAVAEGRPRLANTVRMLEVFSELFGLYPFVEEKYGHAQMRPWGGMENQTMTSLGGDLSDPGAFEEWLISHELSHQWFGNMITMRSWPDVWLNEGFATYAEALYYERIYGKPSYDNAMRKNMLRATNAAGSLFLKDTSTFTDVYISDLVYKKGSAVLHMLRHVVGDAVFFAALKGYATSPQLMFKTASTRDLQSVFEDSSGRDLEFFFQEWVYGKDYPRYLFEWGWTPEGQGARIKLSLHQPLRTSPSFFTMPVDIRISGGGRDTTITVWNDSLNQSWVWSTSFVPVSVSLDPDNWILKSTQGTLLGIDEVGKKSISFELGQNYPNPFNPATDISYSLPLAARLSLTIYDVLGREIAILVDEEKPAGIHTATWNAENAASGMYFYRIEVSGDGGVRWGETKKMVLLR